MKKIIDFTEYNNENFGSKANNLSVLLQNGFNIPNGFIIPATTIQNLFSNNNKPPFDIIENEQKWLTENIQIFENLILQVWKNIQNTTSSDEIISVAIRSSANLEDGNKLSFAGMFTTILNVSNLDDFSKGFHKCLLSKYNNSVLSYCKTNKINPQLIQLNIIVQKMIDADFSGVTFSLNPLTGNAKEMIIETVAGLGENLVQGLISPNRYEINWFEDEIKIIEENKNNSISDKLLQELLKICLDIQKYYGKPQDIEWAIKNNEIFILQSRPLTAIQFDTPYDWTNANLKDGGISSEITTPFMYSLYEYVFETTMPKYLKSVNILPNYEVKKWFTQFMYYSYWNLSATKDGVKKIPGFVELEFDKNLGVEPNYEGKGHVTKTSLKSIIEGIKILFALKKSIKNTIANSKEELVVLDKIILKYKNIDLQDIKTKKLIEKLKTLFFKDYLEVEGSYFNVIYDNSNNTTLFKDAFVKKNKQNKISYLKLITGLQNLSHLQASFELWNLSREILKNKIAKEYFITRTNENIFEEYQSGKEIPFRDIIEKFICKYKYHSEKELDILEPNWDENPKQVFVTLSAFVLRKDSESIIEQNKNQEKVFNEEFAKIKSKKLQKALKNHRFLLWLREEYRDRSSKMYHIIRKTFLEVGEILVKKNKLNNVNDIFFISPPEAIDLLEGKNNLLNKIEKNKLICRSFRNYEKPNEIFSKKHIFHRQNSYKKNKILSGIACSFGVVEGEIYIAKTIKDAEKMPAGKIMLTKFTDPAWTVYFSKIKGLITETGGMLSHGAIISREYGIPAVLGVKNASEILKHGTKIKIDGSLGQVYIL